METLRGRYVFDVLLLAMKIGYTVNQGYGGCFTKVGRIVIHCSCYSYRSAILGLKKNLEKPL